MTSANLHLPSSADTAWLEARSIPEPNTGCWLWLGSVDGYGYGRVMRRDGDGRVQTYGAHRVAFAVSQGSVSPGNVVMHRCDNPPCVNPAHLTQGTPADNARDRDRKGRSRIAVPERRARGERCARSKLNATQVAEIRERFAGGASCVEIAPSYGITAPAVHQIVTRKTWRHAP